MSLRAGVRVGDRYELVGRIAAGGMGEVWRARDTTLGRTVAVKVLRSEYTGDETFLIRFRTEARNTAMLSHPNIAQVYDYGEAMAEGEHVAYLVMELVDGEPLTAVLGNGKRLAPPRALDILGQAAAGLGVAHQAQVVHRDVKPANLILRPDRVVKVTDFGISRAADHVPLTGTGMVVGTAQYLSPEQATGRNVTSASDVYSLGVVGYEALAGRRPFEGESSIAVALAHVNHEPAPLPADIPRPVRDLIGRAMAKDPRHRFSDGADFASAIHQVAQGQPVPTRPDGGPIPVPVPATSPRHSSDGGAPGGGQAAGPRGGKPATARMPAVAPIRTAAPSQRVGSAAPPRRVSYASPPQPAAKSRTGQWVAVLVLVGLLIAMGLLAVRLSQDGSGEGSGSPGTESAAAGPDEGGGSPTGEPPTEESPPPETEPEPEPEPELVFIDTASFIGQPVDDVQAALEDLGLVVETVAVDVTPEALATAGLDDQPFAQDTVIVTIPAQTEVEPGSAVRVFYAAQEYEPDGDGNGSGDGNGGGGG